MVDWIDETMNVSDEVWMWVHRKYGMSQIVRKFNSVETNKYTYLAVTNDGWLNWQKNETYDLKLINSNNNNRLYKHEF